MNKFYDRADYNNLTFKYVGPTKDVSFYEYINSKDLFNAIKSTQIKYRDAKDKQNEFLNKLNNMQICRKTIEQEKVINYIQNFIFLEKKLLIFLETILKCYPMQIIRLKKMKLKEQVLKY